MYRYDALQSSDDIRLVVLSPGVGDEPLQGNLETVSLANTGDYEAISYVWGSEAKPCRLQTGKGNIKLTQSLYDALRSARHPSQPRRLWADSICINQDDNLEKSSQVRMMGKIYATACRVQVYLGVAADRSDVAFNLLEDMASAKWKEDSVAAKDFRVDFANKDLSPVAAIMNRPWWQRVWVIQEFVNAKDVYMIVGSRRLHWKTFFSAIDNVFSHDQLSLSKYYGQYPNASQGMIAFATLDIGRDKSTTRLLELLDLFQNAHATKKRDHLFALLPLADDASDHAFRPDYSEELDSIVRRYAAAFVDRGQISHLLATSCPNTSVKQRKFPSWIPDWTTRRLYRDPDGVSTYPSIYRAAGSTTAKARFDREMDTLFITGSLIDRIETVVHCPSLQQRVKNGSEQDKGVVIRYIAQCLVALRTKYGKQLTEANLDDLRRTLTVDRDQYGEELDRDATSHMKTAYRECIASMNHSEIGLPWPDKDMEVATNAAGIDMIFCNTVEALTDDLAFAITELGFMCLVPTASRTGDWLSIMYGCGVAFVLRPTAPGQVNNEYSLVRKAYLHGFMDGEVLTDDRFPVREILLK